jgi:hypothetical protein
MKSINVLILIAFFVGLISCDKDDTKETSNLDVETYIEMLKANQYESSKLPEFSSNEIPALLKYVNDNSVVNKFPNNPVSSYAEVNPEYRLGVLVLWTIESIRVAACKDKNYLGFPSQNPFVQSKSEPAEWITKHDDDIYLNVKDAYLNWWNINEAKDFSAFCNINPLKDADYQWH